MIIAVFTITKELKSLKFLYANHDRNRNPIFMSVYATILAIKTKFKRNFMCQVKCQVKYVVYIQVKGSLTHNIALKVYFYR